MRPAISPVDLAVTAAPIRDLLTAAEMQPNQLALSRFSGGGSLPVVGAKPFSIPANKCETWETTMRRSAAWLGTAMVLGMMEFLLTCGSQKQH